MQNLILTRLAPNSNLRNEKQKKLLRRFLFGLFHFWLILP